MHWPLLIAVQFSNAATDTQGFIARDDTRREIVVALRGRYASRPGLREIIPVHVV